MRRAEKAARIQQILDGLYPQAPVPLQHSDPYTLLIAVILSAQCTDARVNQISPRLFARASTPSQMIKLPVEEIQSVIKPCGLSPTKAKAIWNLSDILLKTHGGQVPREESDLEALPGVGHKTASVVRAQAFGLPAFPVDTHIHRLAARWGLSTGKNVVVTERDLKKLFAPETWHKLHLQIIFFGRDYCPALYHELESCQICGWAATRKRKREEARRNRELRDKRRKKKDAG